MAQYSPYTLYNDNFDFNDWHKHYAEYCNADVGQSIRFNPNQIVQNTHAELCPVCNGSGKYTEYTFARGQSTGHFDLKTTKTCHGCGGKGWVVIATVYGLR